MPHKIQIATERKNKYISNKLLLFGIGISILFMGGGVFVLSNDYNIFIMLILLILLILGIFGIVLGLSRQQLKIYNIGIEPFEKPLKCLFKRSTLLIPWKDIKNVVIIKNNSVDVIKRIIIIHETNKRFELIYIDYNVLSEDIIKVKKKLENVSEITQQIIEFSNMKEFENWSKKIKINKKITAVQGLILIA